MREPIYPAFPVAEVETAEQLMDIATAMEREAARRYQELAAEMDRCGNTETAALFRQLADDEREHEAQIARWAAREDGRNPEPLEFSWRMPETFDLEKTGGSGFTLTPYQALSIAVRNEERAFAFYSYLAAMAEDDEVRVRAEALAKGELDHVAQLRARRRQAYHAERRGARTRIAVADLEGLYRLALGLERASAELNTAIAEALANAGEKGSAALVRRIAEAARTDAERVVHKARAQEFSGTRTAEAAKTAGVLEAGGLTPLGGLRLCLKNAEEVLQTYLDIAEHAKDEAVLREAQRLGEKALACVAMIGSQLQEISG